MMKTAMVGRYYISDIIFYEMTVPITKMLITSYHHEVSTM